MENEEIFEENNIDTTNEDINSTELDNTESEVKTTNEDNEVDTVESILLLLEERLKEDREALQDEADLFTGSGYEVPEPTPLLIQSVEEQIDYTDLLIQLNDKTDYIASTLSEAVEPDTLATPLNEYNLTNILLVCFLGLFGLSMLYKLIKDNLLHF